jgi:hypothetical protein
MIWRRVKLAAGKPRALLSVGGLNPHGVARTRDSIAISTCHRSEKKLLRSFHLLYVLYLSVFAIILLTGPGSPLMRLCEQ